MTVIERIRPAAEHSAEAATPALLHIHFGTGRLGLGLIAPFFKKQDSRLYLLNRATSGRNETGSTALGPERRNTLLRDSPAQRYFIENPGRSDGNRRAVDYAGFFTYKDSDEVEDIVQTITDAALFDHQRIAVVVTASVLKAENYEPVVYALNTVAGMAETDDGIRSIILVACENTVSAHEVFSHERLSKLVSSAARDRVTCVHALVDRICVGFEEDSRGEHSTLVVRAEDYGSLKLELTPETEHLPELLKGTNIEFSRHVDTEKQIKNWLLNGTHALVALKAFQDANGDPDLKLNEYLQSKPENMDFAREVMEEMGDGIATILRKDPHYAAFARDIDIDGYLAGAIEAILKRFQSTDDPIARILARFQAPTTESFTTIVNFTKRFAERVDEPMRAFEESHGTVPPAVTHSMQSLVRLLASGTFVDMSLG